MRRCVSCGSRVAHVTVLGCDSDCGCASAQSASAGLTGAWAAVGNKLRAEARRGCVVVDYRGDLGLPTSPLDGEPPFREAAVVTVPVSWAPRCSVHIFERT